MLPIIVFFGVLIRLLFYVWAIQYVTHLLGSAIEWLLRVGKGGVDVGLYWFDGCVDLLSLLTLWNACGSTKCHEDSLDWWLA